MYAFNSILDAVDAILCTKESYTEELDERANFIRENGEDAEYSPFSDIMVDANLSLDNILDIDFDTMDGIDSMLSYIPAEEPSKCKMDAKLDLLTGKAIADGDMIDFVVNANK